MGLVLRACYHQAGGADELRLAERSCITSMLLPPPSIEPKDSMVEALAYHYVVESCEDDPASVTTPRRESIIL